MEISRQVGRDAAGAAGVMPRDELVTIAARTLGQCRRLAGRPQLDARGRDLLLRGLNLVEGIVLQLDDEKAADEHRG